MNDDVNVEKKTSKKRIFGYFALAYLGAAGLLVAAVLPAEYGIDPLGIGKLTGIDKLSENRVSAGVNAVDAPPGSLFLQDDKTYKTQTIRIPISDLGAVEHKLLMEKGDTVVFDWHVLGEPKDGGVYFDMHGHPSSVNAADFAEGFVQSYETGEDVSRTGGFTAPFSGYHGLYLLNIEIGDIEVVWNVSGFWDKDIELYREVDGEVINSVEY